MDRENNHANVAIIYVTISRKKLRKVPRKISRNRNKRERERDRSVKYNFRQTKRSFHRSVRPTLSARILLPEEWSFVGRGRRRRGRRGLSGKVPWVNPRLSFRHELSALCPGELAHVNTMIDGIETALESPPTHPPSSTLARRSLQGGHNGPSSVPIFRATPSDGHLTPHPSLVLFDCSMARAAIRSSDHPRAARAASSSNASLVIHR